MNESTLRNMTTGELLKEIEVQARVYQHCIMVDITNPPELAEQENIPLIEFGDFIVYPRFRDEN